ncbi:MAG TPA: OmpA family protein, partial [Verrucomicrobiota bacterium]|nr:OmpA family protein [Verrucomicrobiota bacterium]
MKNLKIKVELLVIVLAMVSVVAGCKRNPQPPLTYIPGVSKPITNEVEGFGKVSPVEIDTNKSVATPIPIPPTINEVAVTPLADRDLIEGMIPDRDTFKSNIIYFDFDRSSIKTSERSKLDAIAKILKSKPETKIQIEGHCDERGTEEYNRALGERRALAAREYLIRSGISADRIFTISYGEDK